jgi:biopolymer transport protein ExbD
VQLDGNSVPLEGLARAVQVALAARPAAVVRMGADESVDYGVVAKVIAGIQAGGGSRLALGTRD